LNDKKMISASLRLTRWLQAKYGIGDRNVIGHAESLSSPYHQEKVVRLRTQTHADWPRRFMVRYRKALAG
jgi:beta-N-acetylhexosaminidase